MCRTRYSQRKETLVESSQEKSTTQTHRGHKMNPEYFSLYSLVTEWIHDKYDIFKNNDECYFFCHFLTDLESENNI